MTWRRSRTRWPGSIHSGIRFPEFLFTKMNRFRFSRRLSGSGVVIMSQLISRASLATSRIYISNRCYYYYPYYILNYIGVCLDTFLLFYTDICNNEKGECRTRNTGWLYRSYIHCIHSSKILNQVSVTIIFHSFEDTLGWLRQLSIKIRAYPHQHHRLQQQQQGGLGLVFRIEPYNNNNTTTTTKHRH